MLSRGIASARHIDHVGLVVPDLEEAVAFFEQALDGHLLWRLGPFSVTSNGETVRNLNLAMLRLGPNMNIELMASELDNPRPMPGTIEVGATHIAIFVEDVRLAVESLLKHGATLLHDPIEVKEGATAGECFCHFNTPWGASMEVLSRPDNFAFASMTAKRLFQPHDTWSDS